MTQPHNILHGEAFPDSEPVEPVEDDREEVVPQSYPPPTSVVTECRLELTSFSSLLELLVFG